MQKKLPSINSAHGSETRNIINEIIKAINDRGIEILSESGFLTWLEKNGIKHREEVATFNDLPANDSLNTVRGVEDENKIYIKKENGWVSFQTIDISKINELDDKLDKANEVIPLSVLQSETPSEDLSRILSNSVNKRFILPYGVKVNLEKQLVISGLDNCDIDFNNVDFTIPDNTEWGTFYIGSDYISLSALTIFNGENITTRNIKIDGNMTNNTKQLFGLVLYNVTNYESFGITFRNVNYHPLHIDDNTKNINFYGRTSFINNCNGITGNSDIFISNLPGDNYYFENVHSERDNHISGQIFYVNGHNGIVDNIKGKNTGAPYDARIGTHHVKNINIDGCETFIVQSYPAATVNERPTLKIDVLNVRNIVANSTGASLMFVTSCHSLDIGKIFLNGKTGSSHNWNVLRISNRPNDLFYPENINIGSIIGSGTTSNGILLSNMSNDVRIGYVEMKVNNRDAHAFSIAGDSNGKLIVDDFKVDGFNYGLVSGAGRTKLLTSKKFIERGTTEERPVNIPNTQTHIYFDTTLNKPIIWNNITWVNLDGSTL